ncbi:uncharacterized protein LOC133795353 [Humulus lupulus]|uniref:uncharacterized protein LOC133795353 n=1 Tax=Humulus lupulus TaxID=3486 RepID=UPI002B415750|nr:uncharacterized protein LOC133795353 [Humulus lupulus]
MDMFREGGSTSRPPMLEGANYPYWKTKMRAFLKAVDERVWMVVEEGWIAPTVRAGEIERTKSMSAWTPAEIELANYNSKAMHALFNAVSTNQLKVIANCEVAKDAWEKLRIKNEGTDAVKKSRLRSLAKAFENLSMDEDETVAEFHAKLCDISNESYALGKTYSNAKLVRKVLGVLPRRFKSKVTSIEEMRDVETLDLDELIGSLQNYEMTLKRWSKNKKPKDSEKDKPESGVAFVHKEEKSKSVDLSGDMSDETFALLTKNYARFLKKNFKQNNYGGKENQNRKQFYNGPKQGQQPEKKNRGIKCRECEGFGHIQAECANTLKKKKAFAVTWSDSDEDKEENSSGDSDGEKQMVAFMARSSKSETSEDEESSGSDEESPQKQEAYEQMFAQWGSSKQLDEKESEIYKITAELVRAKQLLEFIPPGTAAINQTLQLQKPYGDRTSIGYKMLYKKGNDLSIEESSFVTAKSDPSGDEPVGKADGTDVSIKNNTGGKHISGHKSAQGSRFVPICHFCNRRGHIRPKCYKLQNYIQLFVQRNTIFPDKTSKRDERFKSNRNVALVAHTSLAAFKDDMWYFDSGCSRHMTGNKEILMNFKDISEGLVTFGDGNKGQILGKGELQIPGVSPLSEVLYVKGLKANLISISQLCDADYTVSFSKTCCLVSFDGCSILTGNRTADNCYALSTQIKCQRVFLDKPDLWHYRLGHLNYRDLNRIVKRKAVRGIPELKINRDRLCGPCQLGKQIRASHPPVSALATSRVLELLHIDLMGPMQNESLSGKRFVMVCVDDYSRFTWVAFIKEKSDTFGVFSALCLQLQNEKSTKIVKVYRIRSDHGKEFENRLFSDFCDQLGILHEFSAPKTPQQNGVVERKNRTLQEMARVMMEARKITKRFWAEAVNTACYISNRVHLRTGTTQTAYEIWKDTRHTHYKDVKPTALLGKVPPGTLSECSQEFIMAILAYFYYTMGQFGTAVLWEKAVVAVL